MMEKVQLSNGRVVPKYVGGYMNPAIVRDTLRQEGHDVPARGRLNDKLVAIWNQRHTGRDRYIPPARRVDY